MASNQPIVSNGSTRRLRGDSRKATEALSQIILEFEEHYLGPPFPQADINAFVKALPFSPRTTIRFNQFLNRPNTILHRIHQFMSIGILSLSRTFMEVFKNQRDGIWESLLIQLDRHVGAINFYARSRLLPWREALIRYFDGINDMTQDSAPFRTPVLPAAVPGHAMGVHDGMFFNSHPNTFYLRLDGTIEHNQVSSGNQISQQMINLGDSFYNSTVWPAVAPPNWPTNRIYPDHPQNVRNGTPGVDAVEANQFLCCGSCNRNFVAIGLSGGCICAGFRALNTRIQVQQLTPYPSAPNTINKGLVAMQDFPANQFIGEYVGELLSAGQTDAMIPANPFADDVYTMDINAPMIVRQQGRQTTMPGVKIAEVSARMYGNWARFINTSPLKCEWNIEFEQLLIGNRVRLMLRTLRPISFGEELLASYGDEYMKSLLGKTGHPDKSMYIRFSRRLAVCVQLVR